MVRIEISVLVRWTWPGLHGWGGKLCLDRWACALGGFVSMILW